MFKILCFFEKKIQRVPDFFETTSKLKCPDKQRICVAKRRVSKSRLHYPTVTPPPAQPRAQRGVMELPPSPPSQQKFFLL